MDLVILVAYYYAVISVSSRDCISEHRVPSPDVHFRQDVALSCSVDILSDGRFPPSIIIHISTTSLPLPPHDFESYGLTHSREVFGRQSASDLQSRSCQIFLSTHVCLHLLSAPVFLQNNREKEKLYAHYIGEASWAGARIIQGQWTPQATSLYDLLILTFSTNGKLADLGTLKTKSGVSEQAFEDLLQYTTQVWPGSSFH